MSNDKTEDLGKMYEARLNDLAEYRKKGATSHSIGYVADEAKHILLEVLRHKCSTIDKESITYQVFGLFESIIEQIKKRLHRGEKEMKRQLHKCKYIDNNLTEIISETEYLLKKVNNHYDMLQKNVSYARGIRTVREVRCQKEAIWISLNSHLPYEVIELLCKARIKRT